MRTDYKIGIAALVLVGVVITVWSLVSDPEATPEPKDQPQDVARVDDDRDSAARDDRNSSFYGSGRDDDVAPGLGGAITGRPRDGAAGGGARDVDDPAARADALAALRAAMERSRARDAAAGAAAGRGVDWPFPGRGADDGGRDTGIGHIGAPRPAAATQYVVKNGDAGFWTVSEKAYGDGKHWALIAKANPEADSNALRMGQILKVPPLPAADAAPRAGGAAAGAAVAGQLVSRPDGTRHYFVKEGDAGFWSVSKKAYGDGKHWALIAKANPNVNSGALKAGQQLLVPPLPARGASASRTTLARTLKPGEKWYTVVEGDAGFWDVSKKSYGEGNHWEVIAKANPNVNPGRLRAGQKIVVPPLPASSSRSTARTSTPRPAATASRYDDDEPIFE